MLNKRDEIRFSNLHGKRAEHVQKLYGLLKNFFYCATEYIPGVHSEPAKLEKMRDATDEVRTYFDTAQIYFSRSQAKLIETYMNDIRNLVMSKVIDSDPSDSNRYSPDKVVRLQERWKALQEETPKVFEVIEKEFRALLGVEKD
jgi:hypothetical protein